MRRLAIAVIAGTVGLGLVVSAATWRARDDQRAAAAVIGHPPATRPSPTPRPSPTTPRPKVGTWQRLPAAPIEAPYIRESVWTGTEMLVFGRVMSFLPGGDFDVAAAYDPATHTWRKLPAGPDREGSFEGGNQAVWTGSEMLVWGITNKAFNPTTGRWRLLSDPPLSWGGPAVTVWTGRQMIGWGGGCCDDSTADGEAYNPATDSWETLPKAPLAGRQAARGAWTGRELIVMGGGREGKVFADAAAYDPATRSWRLLPRMPEPRTGATAVWDGTEILVVGGGSGQRLYADGVAYDPSTNAWRRLPAMEFPRQGHVAVWTGSQMLVWGGQTEQPGAAARPPHGEAYDPATDSWSALPASVLRGRIGASAVWTGTRMIIWGGLSVGTDTSGWFADGAAYTPGTT